MEAHYWCSEGGGTGHPCTGPPIHTPTQGYLSTGKHGGDTRNHRSYVFVIQGFLPKKRIRELREHSIHPPPHTHFIKSQNKHIELVISQLLVLSRRPN